MSHATPEALIETGLVVGSGLEVPPRIAGLIRFSDLSPSPRCPHSEIVLGTVRTYTTAAAAAHRATQGIPSWVLTATRINYSPGSAVTTQVSKSVFSSEAEKTAGYIRIDLEIAQSRGYLEEVARLKKIAAQINRFQVYAQTGADINPPDPSLLPGKPLV